MPKSRKNASTHLDGEFLDVPEIMKVRITFPAGHGLPSSKGIIRSFETEFTQEELNDYIRILNKPSMFGTVGFTVEVLPQ